MSLDLINPFAGLSPLALGVMALGLFFAALARGYSGFGFSAVLVSSWSLVTDPARAIAVALMLEVAASIVQAVSVWKEIPWRRVAILLAGALIGSPLGVYFLATLPLDVMRLVVSLFVLVSASLMLLGWKLRKKASEWGTGAVGIASGVANGAVGMGGLPVALFLTAAGDSPARIRAAIVAYFFFLDIIGLTFLLRADLVFPSTALSAVIAFPVMMIGMFLGARHFLGATPESFRRVTLFMLLLIAAIGLAKTFMVAL